MRQDKLIMHIGAAAMCVVATHAWGGDVRALVAGGSSGAESAKSQAVEASLPIRELKPETVLGSYFSATDRAPKAGEFKYMTQGAMSVQGLPVAFTILSNGSPKASVEPALRMLKTARRE